MPKFIIEVERTRVVPATIRIEAADIEEAWDKAEAIREEYDGQWAEHWAVLDAKHQPRFDMAGAAFEQELKNVREDHQ